MAKFIIQMNPMNIITYLYPNSNGTFSKTTIDARVMKDIYSQWNLRNACVISNTTCATDPSAINIHWLALLVLWMNRLGSVSI